METDSSEPLEPDRIITPAEQIRDPREGVADARKIRGWKGARARIFGRRTVNSPGRERDGRKPRGR
jgi:hypothetical protein